ncbi:MAG TPA: aconitate hydratase AcnA [Ktedonobacterales bacterium]|nr:aconitate hydratase AcnA [Ktedonobacterales bacterium]
MLDVRSRLDGTELDYYALSRLPGLGLGNPDRLPVTVKIMIEMLLRDKHAPMDALTGLAQWIGGSPLSPFEIPFRPARVLLHDYTGAPALVDLAAMRDAMARAGKDPRRINPVIPTVLVIDHSVQVATFGSERAYQRNIVDEYAHNGERYAFLRWAQRAFDNFTLVPPGMGICHQINLEYLSRCVQIAPTTNGRPVVMPDTVIGTDSHTPMVNGIGVLGWGVGGMEAEACMLGEPLYLSPPVVVGVRFRNALLPGVTATDLVLTLTNMLRQHGVVNEFVEFCGDGLSSLSVADRATLANMCPEYGATAAYFPVDHLTLRYLEMSNREPEHIRLVERYCKEQGLFRTDGAPLPTFSELVELDLSTVEPSLAGPKRPQDRVSLSGVWSSFVTAFPRAEAEESQHHDAESASTGGSASAPAVVGAAAEGQWPDGRLQDGAVVIAAITSCTNTSNPSVMVAAGLLAKKAVEAGLTVPLYVKTSLAPGSRVVTEYLREAGLLPYLEQLGFHVVAYGCTTCIGSSGPLASPDVEAEVERDQLAVAAVLSGNRNFEARIHPLVRANYLASPPLVVAYALAGTVHINLTTEPVGYTRDGRPIFLKDLWPPPIEIERIVRTAVHRDMFAREYASIYDGDESWRQVEAPSGATFLWEPDSTYVREPPFFAGLAPEPQPPQDIVGARVLVCLGDSITTDHVTPAGQIPVESPAGRYLVEHGVRRQDFNTYGTRRGNCEVIARSAWANVRLRNALAGGKEGFWTSHQPSGDLMSIFDAAERYRTEGTPLIALAGKEYGTGSSRDSAAKGPWLLGVRAVIAESYERIHRANLVSMGILPLQYLPGVNRQTLGLTGTEEFTVRDIAAGMAPGQRLDVEARGDGGVTRFSVVARVDNMTEVAYLHHGGVLQMILRGLLTEG